MQGPFPSRIKKVGIFPLSYGNQGNAYLNAAKKRLNSWGIDYVMPQPKKEFRYMAATDEERADIFNTMLADESIDFLFALRGGFGAARALPLIDWELLLKRNIPVAGFSDMTAFLMGAYSKGFMKGISGVMAEATFGDYKSSERKMGQAVKAMYNSLNGQVVSLPYKGRPKAIKSGQVSAAVVPANLGVLDCLIGTPWMPKLEGTILVLEGIGMISSQIDRVLTQFKQCGIFESLAGIVFGAFTVCEDPKYQPEIFREFASLVDGPSYYGMPFGHILPSAVIQVGQRATLSVSDDGVVNFS